jgi:hypothetical protein
MWLARGPNTSWCEMARRTPLKAAPASHRPAWFWEQTFPAMRGFVLVEFP